MSLIDWLIDWLIDIFSERYIVTDYAKRNKLLIEEIDSIDKYTRVLPLGVPSGCNNLFLLVTLENCEKRQVEEVFSCGSAYVFFVVVLLIIFLISLHFVKILDIRCRVVRLDFKALCHHHFVFESRCKLRIR